MNLPGIDILEEDVKEWLSRAERSMKMKSKNSGGIFELYTTGIGCRACTISAGLISSAAPGQLLCHPVKIFTERPVGP